MNISAGKRSVRFAVTSAAAVAVVTLFAGTVGAATGLGTVRVSEVINGGTANVSAFTVMLKNQSGSDTISISSSNGMVTFTAQPGIYTVSQTGPSGYKPTFSGACDASGKVTITSGASLSCTITDTFGVIPPVGGGSTGGSGSGRDDRGTITIGGNERPIILRPTR